MTATPADPDLGRLHGGPYDGFVFSMNGKWRAFKDGTTRLANFVLVAWNGIVCPGWLEAPAVIAHSFPASRYDLDGDDPGYLYRYVGETP